MSVQQAPKPWKIEMLGLMEMVRFSHPEGRVLFWVPEGWFIEQGGLSISAHLPPAKTMKQARQIGTTWLYELEVVDA